MKISRQLIEDLPPTTLLNFVRLLESFLGMPDLDGPKMDLETVQDTPSVRPNL